MPITSLSSNMFAKFYKPKFAKFKKHCSVKVGKARQRWAVQTWKNGCVVVWTSIKLCSMEWWFKVHLSTVSMIWSASGIQLENASWHSALCPLFSSVENRLQSGDFFWQPWSQFMINVAPTSTAKSWMAVSFLRWGISMHWSDVSFRMKTPVVISRGSPLMEEGN